MSYALPSFGALAVKSAVVHTVTYFLVGLIALSVFDYRNLYADGNVRALMRQVSDPVVMSGPLFQPLRGVLFATAFFPFREMIFTKVRGWLLMVLLLIVLGVFNTFGPSPGSVEGLIYTVLPIKFQLIGLPEVLAQATLYAIVLHYWVTNPDRKWLSRLLYVSFALIIALVVLGLLATAK